MFAKLLKYEFKNSAKVIGPASIAAVVAGIIGFFLFNGIFNQELFSRLDATDIPSAVQLGLIAGIVILLFSSFLVILIYMIGSSYYLYYRFYKTKFTDEGYLTFTLPATTGQILNSSLLNTAIWIIFVGIVGFGSAAICFYPIFSSVFHEIEEYTTLYQDIWEAFAISPAQIFSAFVSGIFGLILPLASLTVGCLLVKKYKILVSIAIYYGVNMVISTVNSVLFSGYTIAAAISQNTNYDPAIATMGSSMLQLAITIGAYILMHHLLNKKLNI